MKVYKEVPATGACTVLDSVKCDLCGAPAPTTKFDEADWSKDCYEVSETEMRYKFGESYSDAGWGEEYDIDICPACFKEKFLPWLRSLGVMVKPKEWRW